MTAPQPQDPAPTIQAHFDTSKELLPLGISLGGGPMAVREPVPVDYDEYAML